MPLDPNDCLLAALGIEPYQISPETNDIASLPRILLKLAALEIRVAILEEQARVKSSGDGSGGSGGDNG